MNSSDFFGSELGYFVLLFALFVIPRVLQRWRLPAAVTSVALGAIAGPGFGVFVHDPTVHLLSTFGIVALFLFAGLEVEVEGLRSEVRVLGQHLAVQLVLLICVMVIVAHALGIGTRPAALIALALVTPSTGFIIDSLDAFGLSPQERFWVKNKAIAAELLALAVLFFVLQTTSVSRLVLASLALAAIVAILPPMFRGFAVWIAPYAPKSEFAFLLMMALLAAYATRNLGVYYLVGAFLVGVAAARFRRSLPALASERMVHAVEVFGSFFAPFYFFAAGSDMHRDSFSLWSIAAGLGLVLVLVPLRLLVIAVHRRFALGEPFSRSARVAVPMVPTLVFTLVLVGILRDDFGAGPVLVGALTVYTLLNTLIPGFVLGTAVVPSFEGSS